MVWRSFLLILALVAGACRPGQQSAPNPPANRAERIKAQVDAAKGMFYPLPARPAGVDKDPKAALGRMLFFDRRLSGDRVVSCNSCHRLDAYGVDGETASTGGGRRHGTRNAPTVYNVALYFVQYWDGRAASVEQQAEMALTNPAEMANASARQAVEVLQAIPGYVRAFGQAFPGEQAPISLHNIGVAIGAFERGLLTPARWDRFLAGDKAALSDAERAGFSVFLMTGCMACHNGRPEGLFQKIGIVYPWPNQKDRGRVEVTKRRPDTLGFRVPLLRNVEKTAPYFHDGSVDTLEGAVGAMALYELGKQLSLEKAGQIATFLRALTGEIPRDYIREPPLPPDSVTMAKP